MEGKAIIALDQKAIKNIIKDCDIDVKALIKPMIPRIIESQIKETVQEYMNNWIKWNLEDNCHKLFDEKIKYTLYKIVEEYHDEKDHQNIKKLVKSYYEKVRIETQKKFKEWLAYFKINEDKAIRDIIKEEVINYFKGK